MESGRKRCHTVSVSEQAFLWTLPVLVAAVIGLELRYGRIPLGWTPSGWRMVERTQDEGTFRLLIIAESLLVLILIGQALSA